MTGRNKALTARQRNPRRIMDILSRVKTAALSTLYPEGAVCICCGAPMPGGALCGDCRAELDACRISGDMCPACGEPLLPDRPCRVCEAGIRINARSIWLHKDVPRRLVHRLKYGGCRAAATLLGQGMAEEARRTGLPADTVVTWVTMPDVRYRGRHADHAQLLAEALGRELGTPVRRLLSRTDRAARMPRQTQVLGRQRLANVKGSFLCEGHVPPSVLLADDVLTTGATAAECARCLTDGGAERVLVLTASRSYVHRGAGRAGQE